MWTKLWTEVLLNKIKLLQRIFVWSDCARGVKVGGLSTMGLTGLCDPIVLVWL